jgi:hypothetical protein
MRQITTPTTWTSAKRNAAVVAAGIRCQAVDCANKATRWSNLCGLCEKQWLEDHKPVFGKPTPDQLKSAQSVLKDHYDKVLQSGVFDDWSSQIGRTFSRPESRLVAPLSMRRYRTPTERLTPLLAMRTRDRGVLTKKGVLNLMAYALVIDALITPTIPVPVRKDYMIALLGQRFVGREVYSKTTLRYRSKRVKTGVIRYGPNGPEELTQRIEEEVPEKEYYRIRRADMRFIGRRLWKAFETTLLAGGRSGSEWKELIRKLLVNYAESS